MLLDFSLFPSSHCRPNSRCSSSRLSSSLLPLCGQLFLSFHPFPSIYPHQSSSVWLFMGQMVRTYTILRARTEGPSWKLTKYPSTTAMAVAWNTYKQLSAPTVHYGLSATALTQTAVAPSGTAASVTYKTSRTWANTVLISGLTPATTYCAFIMLCVRSSATP